MSAQHLQLGMFDSYFQRFGGHRDLMLKFFIIFSRAEFTLKESGFARRGRHDIAEADWERFALNIEPNFDPQGSPELIAAIDYLTNHPPRLRKLDPANNLIWSANVRRPRQTHLQWLLSLVTEF